MILKNYKGWVNEQTEVRILLASNKKLEEIPRISDAILELLIKQAAFELESSQIYREMACWLNREGWPAATEYYMGASDEELDHYKDVFKYIFYKNSDANTLPIPEVKSDYGCIRDIVESSLEHEMKVTENWNSIANAALEAKDNDTYMLAQKFLKEQQDEEDKFRFVLNKMNLDMPRYEIDAIFKDLS